jgi:negative regulator of sigma E activity
MSEKLKEALSAAVDGEADEFELRRVIDEAAKDAALRDTWERYHLVSAVLAGRASDASIASRRALKGRIWEALDYAGGDVEEPVAEQPAIPPAKGLPVWMGRAVGFAVALGVAAAIMFGAGVLDETPTGQVAALDVVEATPPSDADMTRSDAYMMHHVQHTALNSSGVLSFVKVVTYDRSEGQQ